MSSMGAEISTGTKRKHKYKNRRVVKSGSRTQERNIRMTLDHRDRRNSYGECIKRGLGGGGGSGGHGMRVGDEKKLWTGYFGRDDE
jgi:hypothetical protein